jgi:hypothetical protein
LERRYKILDARIIIRYGVFKRCMFRSLDLQVPCWIC